MILADVASKDAIKAQMDQERQLMQIQLDQQEEQIKQYQTLCDEVNQRADNLQSENDDLRSQLGAANSELKSTQEATNLMKERVMAEKVKANQTLQNDEKMNAQSSEVDQEPLPPPMGKKNADPFGKRQNKEKKAKPEVKRIVPSA